MSENKKILKYCPNYYQIIDFNPLADDELTQKIEQVRALQCA